MVAVIGDILRTDCRKADLESFTRRRLDESNRGRNAPTLLEMVFTGAVTVHKVGISKNGQDDTPSQSRSSSLPAHRAALA